MRTKTALDPRPTVEDVRRMLAGPLEMVIEDAVAYWLEDDEGHRLGPESDRSLEVVRCHRATATSRHADCAGGSALEVWPLTQRQNVVAILTQRTGDATTRQVRVEEQAHRRYSRTSATSTNG